MSKGKIHDSAKQWKSQDRNYPCQLHGRIILLPDKGDYCTKAEQAQHKSNFYVIITPYEYLHHKKADL